MIDKKRIDEAKNNFNRYLNEGLIKKEENKSAFITYLKNSELSLKVADKLIKDELKPYLWVVVCSYYSMFYIANAVFLNLEYRTKDKIVHKVTSDALIVLVLNKLKKELIEEYEKIMNEALEIASAKAEDMMRSYDYEMNKRGRFQYEMSEEVKETKAKTSLERAKEFVFDSKDIRERASLESELESLNSQGYSWLTDYNVKNGGIF